MTSIRIMCDQSDGTTVSLGAIKTDSDCTIIYSAHPSLIDGKFRDPVTLALLRWIGRLALNLWEHNGERPIPDERGEGSAARSCTRAASASPTASSNGGNKWLRAHGVLSTEWRQCSEKER